MQPLNPLNNLNEYPELVSIQIGLNPSYALSIHDLTIISLSLNLMINHLHQAVIGLHMDINRFRAIEPQSLTSLDERTQRFVHKIFKIIKEMLNEIAPLRDFLNKTLPFRLNRQDIITRTNAVPSQFPQIVAEYTGPDNPEKERLIIALCLEQAKRLMALLHINTVKNIVNHPATS